MRARHEELEAITSLMMNAGFPCFSYDSIKKLQGRFFIDKSPKETTTEILKLVDDALKAASRLFMIVSRRCKMTSSTEYIYPI